MHHTNPNLFLISGGPGSRKTTVLRELAMLGFQYAPEVARRIIQEQMQAGGHALPSDDREAYKALMLQRSIASYLEHTPALKPVFSHRGIPDTLGYARLVGLREQSAMQSACRRYRYASLVFVAPPWPEIYQPDSERKQDFAEAQRTFVQVTEVYRNADTRCQSCRSCRRPPELSSLSGNCWNTPESLRRPEFTHIRLNLFRLNLDWTRELDGGFRASNQEFLTVSDVGRDDGGP